MGLFRLFRLWLLCAAMLGLSCGGNRGAYSGVEIYSPSYAKGFVLYAAGEYSSVLEVKNPWQGAEGVSAQLFISRRGEAAPEGFDGQSVKAPLERVVCLSSTHVACIDALGEIDAVKGVSGARYITNPVISQRYAEGMVRDVGYDTNVNYELLASLRPDVVFIYGVAGENTALTGKLRELGLTVMYIADYLEEEPLGKTEWIVPFGEMFNKTEQAKAIFEGIADRYETLRREAATLTDRPGVMLNAPYRDVWFVPGDRSYMVRLIEDAGGRYVCAGEDSSVSRPISGEAAYMAVSEADVWINPNQATTLKEVKEQNPKFADVKAIKTGRVYNATKRNTPGGGSDFWESGALRADRALEDLIICLHPNSDIIPEGETYYFEQLK